MGLPKVRKSKSKKKKKLAVDKTSLDLSVRKDLLDLAQGLVTYCTLNGSDKGVILEISLPKSIVENASALILINSGTVTNVYENKVNRFTVNLDGGTVNFKSTENTQGALNGSST